jgi:hypothetical protein
VADAQAAPTYPGQIFCQYAGGKCPETFSEPNQETILFLYPSKPQVISSTIEEAASSISAKNTNKSYITWRDLRTEGKTIFCGICKAIVSSSYLVCDITTLNFNLLFEIGYVFGLGKPFIPVFDTTYGHNKKMLAKIGLLDTIAYRTFLNSADLEEAVKGGAPVATLQRSSNIDTFRPIYYLKTPLDTGGSLRITSILKKSWFRFRVYDPNERSRLQLNWAIRDVDKSRAVVVHLLDPRRRQAAMIHNARCAFVAGLAMASQKRTLLIQEGKADHPIDYRELIRDYESPSHINVIMGEFFRSLVDTLQSPVKSVAAAQRSPLEDIDIGDVAAENEIENLRSYYVRTGQFATARKGHAQLVVGRKGTGKTALFYALRHQIGPERTTTLVLDLKPEGYQFANLHETILQKFTPAVRQHTLTAIWDYVLLLELAHKILTDKNEMRVSIKAAATATVWNAISDEYRLHRSLEEGDFSERLNNLVQKIISRFPIGKVSLSAPEITQVVFSHDIKRLRELLVDYMTGKEEVWLLFDNLDKNWKVNREDDYEAVILRCLLDASRKLQKMLTKDGVNFRGVVFIRNDIYSFFLDRTTDRGKEQVVQLNWDDVDIFKEIFRLRVGADTPFSGQSDELWSKIFDVHVRGQNSFNYIVERTLMRPRDFLLFIHHALQTAINRGHGRILEEDILHGEEAYSRDLFESLSYELRDIEPGLEDILYCFLESKRRLHENELTAILKDGKIPPSEMQNAIGTLLWFSFLGVVTSDTEERYAYSVGYDTKKLLKLSDRFQKENSERIYTIHPGFTKVLEVKE